MTKDKIRMSRETQTPKDKTAPVFIFRTPSVETFSFAAEPVDFANDPCRLARQVKKIARETETSSTRNRPLPPRVAGEADSSALAELGQSYSIRRFEP
jgi:hypothetical protein